MKPTMLDDDELNAISFPRVEKLLYMNCMQMYIMTLYLQWNVKWTLLKNMTMSKSK